MCYPEVTKGVPCIICFSPYNYDLSDPGRFLIFSGKHAFPCWYQHARLAYHCHSTGNPGSSLSSVPSPSHNHHRLAVYYSWRRPTRVLITIPGLGLSFQTAIFPLSLHTTRLDTQYSRWH